MHKLRSRFHIGLRTVKTVIAVLLSMVVVDFYGATASKLIFAMVGAMAAVQPTFRESLESCLTQIVGVLFGAVAGILLMLLPLPSLMVCGIGIVLVITLYNALKIRFSPSLPCFIVVMLCTTPDIQPVSYALGRVWDSAIGLGIGMLINTLVFPYDNSRQIHFAAESLDQELIRFLEELFDGDRTLPDAERMVHSIDTMDRQVTTFSNQKLLLRLRHQKKQLEKYRSYEEKARKLVAHTEVLCRMDVPGRLNEENRRRLEACGATIRDERPLDSVMEQDIVTNYHVSQILTLRRELLDVLENK